VAVQGVDVGLVGRGDVVVLGRLAEDGGLAVRALRERGAPVEGMGVALGVAPVAGVGVAVSVAGVKFGEGRDGEAELAEQPDFEEVSVDGGGGGAGDGAEVVSRAGLGGIDEDGAVLVLRVISTTIPRPLAS
jgi:hypothetical protein